MAQLYHGGRQVDDGGEFRQTGSRKRRRLLDGFADYGGACH